MGHDIAGIILAAGRSSRMGRPKLTLPVGPETFLEHAARTLSAAECVPVLAVVNADWTDDCAAELGIEVVVNPDAASEQIDSLRLALGRLESNIAAVMVLPVDLPLVSPDTAAAVAKRFREQHALIVAPFYNGVAGHPLLLARELFGDLMEDHWEEGVRSIIMAHASSVREVIVADPGILIDIDTPAEYRHYVERM